MTEDSNLIAIEQAQRETPVCELCDSPTIPVAHGDEVWLQCVEDRQEKSMLRRLISLEFAGAHTRRLIVRAERTSAA